MRIQACIEIVAETFYFVVLFFWSKLHVLHHDASKNVMTLKET